MVCMNQTDMTNKSKCCSIKHYKLLGWLGVETSLLQACFNAGNGTQPSGAQEHLGVSWPVMGWEHPDILLPMRSIRKHLRDIHETGLDLDKNVRNVSNITNGIPAKSETFSSHPQVSWNRGTPGIGSSEEERRFYATLKLYYSIYSNNKLKNSYVHMPLYKFTKNHPVCLNQLHTLT